MAGRVRGAGPHPPPPTTTEAQGAFHAQALCWAHRHAELRAPPANQFLGTARAGQGRTQGLLPTRPRNLGLDSCVLCPRHSPRPRLTPPLRGWWGDP